MKMLIALVVLLLANVAKGEVLDPHSVVDALKSANRPATFVARRALARELGVVDATTTYRGSAEQNEKMLQLLKSDKSGNSVVLPSRPVIKSIKERPTASVKSASSASNLTSTSQKIVSVSAKSVSTPISAGTKQIAISGITPVSSLTPKVGRKTQVVPSTATLTSSILPVSINDPLSISRPKPATIELESPLMDSEPMGPREIETLYPILASSLTSIDKTTTTSSALHKAATVIPAPSSALEKSSRITQAAVSSDSVQTQELGSGDNRSLWWMAIICFLLAGVMAIIMRLRSTAWWKRKTERWDNWRAQQKQAGRLSRQRLEIALENEQATMKILRDDYAAENAERQRLEQLLLITQRELWAIRQTPPNKIPTHEVILAAGDRKEFGGPDQDFRLCLFASSSTHPDWLQVVCPGSGETIAVSDLVAHLRTNTAAREAFAHAGAFPLVEKHRAVTPETSSDTPSLQVVRTSATA